MCGATIAPERRYFHDSWEISGTPGALDYLPSHSGLDEMLPLKEISLNDAAAEDIAEGDVTAEDVVEDSNFESK